MKLASALTGLTVGILSQGTMAASTSTGGEWQHSFAPLFLWGVSIDATSTVGGNEAPLDLDFKDDVLENLEAAWTMRYEARKDRLGFFFEYQYYNLAPESQLGPLSADVDFKQTTYEIGMIYALNESDTTRWEILGGVRSMDQDVEVDVSVGLPDLPWLPESLDREIKAGDEFVQPFIGGRVDHSFNKKWSLISRADYGYAESDNRSFNISLVGDYRFRDWGSFFFGYKYMDYDLDNGNDGQEGYAFDGNMQGPVMGLNLRW